MAGMSPKEADGLSCRWGRAYPERGSTMADVVVMGGGTCGLATAMLLARAGFEVTVIERDAEEPPPVGEDVFTCWKRRGVPQFHQAHFVQPRFRILVQRELPDVYEALVAAGGARFDMLTAMPPFIADRTPREVDDRLWTMTARRPVLESVFARAAQDEPRLDLRRGEGAVGLLTSGSVIDGVPHVRGVRTSSGVELRADLVIDAMGRRSPLPEWLSAVGGRPPLEEAEDGGFTYYTRYFRSRDGSMPMPVGPLMAAMGTLSVITIHGDNSTWMIVLYCGSGDMPLKGLRDRERWTRVVASMPRHAHWLDGEPITDVLPMSGILDKRRAFVLDGKPVVTGLLPVADAWASTNPSYGRGLSNGVDHVVRLRDHVCSRLDDPKALAEEWYAIGDAEFRPSYEFQVQLDRARVAEMLALREGREPPQPDPADDKARIMKEFLTAATYDPDVFRGFLEVGSCLATPEEVLGRVGMVDKILTISDGKEPITCPGPSRAQLLALVA
jgi:2-polyprenyl-6-methoxyphenol hydroxylase-like FAD-dependent oxidoreductase